MTDAELDKVMEDNRQQFIEKNISYIAKKEKGSLSCNFNLNTRSSKQMQQKQLWMSLPVSHTSRQPI